MEGDGFLEVIRAVGIRDEVGGFRLRHLDLGAQDDAGQAHAADGGPEKIAVFTFRGQVQDAAVGDEQLHGGDVVTKGTGGVVVLAVDIRANSAADGDLAGTRQNRNPQAVRQGGLHELVQGDATVDVDNARLRIDGVDFVERLHVDDEATGVLRGVTVGAAHTAGDDATAQVGRLISIVLSHLGDGRLDDVDVWGGQNVGGCRRRAAPTVEGLLSSMQFHLLLFDSM